jgi:hypothetical protein
MARRNDQARCRPLQLDDREMGMGRAAEGIEILNGCLPLSAALVRRRIGRLLYRDRQCRSEIGIYLFRG